MKLFETGALGIASAVLCLGVASAQTVEPADTADGTAALTVVAIEPEDIVAARRATYFLSTQAIGQIKAGIDEGGDLRRTRAGAMMLANWAKVLPAMFPEGTDLESSRALPTVWSDRAGFELRAENYREAALELANVAQSGDRQAANAAFLAMAGTCHDCHKSYREE